MRNVGGSIGISIATTLLTRRADAHQNDLTNYIPRSGAGFQSALGQAQSSLGNYFGPANAQAAAQANLYGRLQLQASLWSFVDVFRWLSLLCFFCVIIVWMLKKVRPGKGPAGAH